MLARNERQHGFLMLEAALTVIILSVGILALVLSLSKNHRALSTVNEIDEAQNALENVAERLRAADLSTVYNTYNGRTVAVPALEDSAGNTAAVRIDCFLDETRVPAEFGPCQDIDGKPGTNTVVSSSNYELLPVRLRLTYQASDGVRTDESYVTLGSE